MFVLGPSDNKVNDSKSDMTDARFGGARQVTGGIQKAEDYTKRTTDARDFVENPEATLDVDDLNDPTSRKSDTKRQQDLMKAGDETPLVVTDAGAHNKPLDEGREDSAFQLPDKDKPHGASGFYNPYFVESTGE